MRKTPTSSSAGQNSSEKSASDSKKPMACSHWAAGAVKYVRLCADTVAVVAGGHRVLFYFLSVAVAIAFLGFCAVDDDG